ncbi:MAG: hypothetical protein WCA29_03810 [Jiangellales bacterium]
MSGRPKAPGGPGVIRSAAGVRLGLGGHWFLSGSGDQDELTARTAGAAHGTIRLVGLGTPERGRCGYTNATRIAKRTAPAGTVVRLGNPRSVDNRDTATTASCSTS